MRGFASPWLLGPVEASMHTIELRQVCMINGIMERQYSISYAKSIAATWALTLLPLFLAHILGGLIFTTAAAVGGIASYFLTPRLSPVLVLRLYKGVPISSHQMPGLHRLVADISVKAGLDSAPGLWILSSRRPVAFVTGDRTSSALALSEGILNTLDTDELASVVAHELSHVAHNDNRIMLFSEVTVRMVHLLFFVGMLMILFNLSAIFSGERHVSLVLLAVVVCSPIAALLLQLMLLRSREFAADTGSAELMGSPLPLIRALNKLEGRRNVSLFQWLPRQHEQKGHTLLRTHPPVRERIDRLKKLSKEEGT